MPTKTDPALVASELRDVLGRLVRRLRAEHRFPLSHGMVLGRLDRVGVQSVSDLAHAEGIRPQSMAPSAQCPRPATSVNGTACAMSEPTMLDIGRRG